MNVLSVRGTKFFQTGSGTRVALNVDVFNMLNSGDATSTEWRAGSAFGEINNILAPRIMRVSFDFRF